MPTQASAVVLWREDSPRPERPAGAVSDTADPASWLCLWGAPLTSGDPNRLARELLETYRRKGVRFPEALPLPAACVLWDDRLQQLVASCDRMGIRPVYYRLAKARVEIAGSVATLPAGLHPPLGFHQLNPRALACQLAALPAPPGETLFAGVYRLPPGCTLTVDRQRTTRVAEYWQLTAVPPLVFGRDADYAEALRELLFAVVPEYAGPSAVGVTLSSGLDSPAVAAALKASSSSPRLTALSWTSPELPEADESAGVEAISRQLDLDLLLIRGDRLWPFSSDCEIDPPLSGPPLTFYGALWNETFARARAADLTRLFTGFGGDHLFGGDVYSYPDLLLSCRWVRLARELRSHLPLSSFGLGGLLRRMLLRPLFEFVRPPSDSPDRARFPWVSERVLQTIPARRNRRFDRALLPGRRARMKLLGDPLLPRAAEQLDQAAAGFGVDLVHPLLDYRLVEFAARLPTTQSFEAGRRKGIVRRALAGRLPASILEQVHKTYPAAIARRGLGERETAKVWTLISGMKLAEMGWVEESSLRQAYQDYLDGRGPYRLLWPTLTLEAWLRRHCA